jgi:hypothetical protein
MKTWFFNAGGSFRKLESHNYQHVLDLLGGAYFEDIDGFIKAEITVWFE